jgi:predicted double-glycine peptidase
MAKRYKNWFENILHLPVVHQTHNYDCGAAALRAVAHYYGVGPDREGDFIKACDTSKELGTDPTDIIKAARGMGLRAKRFEGMGLKNLMGFLQDGKPVICAVQAWGEEEDYDELESGHYVVAIGFDERYIFFEDPSVKGDKARGHMPHGEFIRRWADVDRRGKTLEQFGIVVWRDEQPKEQDVVSRSREIE